MLYEIHGHPSGEICAEWVFLPSRVIFGNEDILPTPSLACSKCMHAARENPKGWRRYDYHCQNCGTKMINPRLSIDTIAQEIRFRKIRSQKHF